MLMVMTILLFFYDYNDGCGSDYRTDDVIVVVGGNDNYNVRKERIDHVI